MALRVLSAASVFADFAAASALSDAHCAIRPHDICVSMPPGAV